ncbi:MAG: hypothetical protein AAFV53_28125 [Myxococcota bacterium]
MFVHPPRLALLFMASMMVACGDDDSSPTPDPVVYESYAGEITIQLRTTDGFDTCSGAVYLTVGDGDIVAEADEVNFDCDWSDSSEVYSALSGTITGSVDTTDGGQIAFSDKGGAFDDVADWTPDAVDSDSIEVDTGFIETTVDDLSDPQVRIRFDATRE